MKKEFADSRAVVHTCRSSDNWSTSKHQNHIDKMKATAPRTNKAERLAQLNAARARHHNALEALAAGHPCDGLKAWRALRRLERTARAHSTAYCNGDRIGAYNYRADGCEAFERFKRAEVIPTLVRIFGHVPPGFYLNGDARGCALKIHAEHVPAGMVTDWGRDGILAAEIDG
jgi:hypothetical protein